jgi:hypothetical protein
LIEAWLSQARMVLMSTSERRRCVAVVGGGMRADTLFVKLSQPLSYVVFRFAKSSIHEPIPTDHNITGKPT